MSLMYLLGLPRNGANVWGYGAIIDYERDGSVVYTNGRTGPGRPLHTWQSSADNQGRGPFMPTLRRGLSYSLHGDADYEPANSLALALTFYDAQGHVAADNLYEGLDATFTVPDDARRYTIELVSLNNTHFVFRSLLLGQTTDLAGGQLLLGEDGRSVQYLRAGQLALNCLVLCGSRELVTALPVQLARQTDYWWVNARTRMNPHALAEFVNQRRAEGPLRIVAAGPDTSAIAKLLTPPIN